MKKFVLLLKIVIVFVLLCLSGACKKPESKPEKKKPIPTMVIDIDGNTYNVKRYGNRVWMTENLRVTRYDTNSLRVEDTIFVADGSYVITIEKPYLKDARNFNDSPDTDNLTDEIRNSMGFLYNWSAAAGTTAINTTVADKVQGICPNGWRLPTTNDFDTLCIVLGGQGKAGKSLKSVEGWFTNSGTNESGFNCYPAGMATGNWVVSMVGRQTMFWSSKSATGNITKATVMGLYFNHDDAGLFNVNKYQANSVRCVLDLDDSYIGF